MQFSFPTDFKHLPRKQSKASSAFSIVNLADSATAHFSWQDMQALHSFLVFCPPALPLGNRDTWTRDIVQQAHHRPCLMDALLALGVSHVLSLTGSSDTGQAIQRRGNAIRGLSNLISKPAAWSVEDTDTALSISYALAFQASYISDGLDDYLVMVNGCKLITEHVRKYNLSTHFDVSLRRTQSKLEQTTAPIMRGVVYKDLIDEAEEAMKTLKGHIQDPAELALCQSVEMVLRSFDAGACVGVLGSLDMYGLWYQLAGPHLKVLARVDNGMSLVLLTCFLSIQLIYRILLPYRWFPTLVRSLPPGRTLHEVMEWVAALVAGTPHHLQQHLFWAKPVIDRIPMELVDATTASSSTSNSRSKLLHVKDMSNNAHIVLSDILRVTAELATWQEKLFQARVESVIQARRCFDMGIVEQAGILMDDSMPAHSIVPHDELPRMVAEINDLMRNQGGNGLALLRTSALGINAY